MDYHGSCQIHQAETIADVYANVSAWEEHGRWVWRGNFASTPSAPALHLGDVALAIPGTHFASIAITSIDITYPDSPEYDGEFTGHGVPPAVVQRQAGVLPFRRTLAKLRARLGHVEPPNSTTH